MDACEIVRHYIATYRQVRKMIPDPIMVTPDAAEKWLANRAPNRPLSQWSVNQIIASGIDNEVQSVLRFDTEGRLLDGQTRMEAVRRSGQPLLTYIEINVPAAPIRGKADVIQRKWSPGDHFALAGYVDSNAIAAGVRWMWRYDSGNVASGSPPPIGTDLVAYAEPYRDDLVRQTRRMGRDYRVFRSKAVAVAAATLIGPHDAREAFFDEAINGNNKPSAAATLHKALLANATCTRKASDTHVFAWTIKAFNAYARGGNLKYLRLREDGDSPESFPSFNHRPPKEFNK